MAYKINRIRNRIRRYCSAHTAKMPCYLCKYPVRVYADTPAGPPLIKADSKVDKTVADLMKKIEKGTVVPSKV